MPIHISRGDESSGPYSLEEVQTYLDQGLLFPADLAWQEGLEDWIPLSQLLGQSAALEPASSPPVMAELVSAESVPAEPAAKPRSRKGLLIGIGAGVAVLAIAAGVWFGLLRPDGSKQGGPLVAQGGGPKDKGASAAVPAKTNAPVNSQPGVTNGSATTTNSQPAGTEDTVVKTNTPAGSGTQTIPEGTPPDSTSEKPLPKELEALKALAEKGDAKAQYELGKKYYHGTAVERNFREAIKWYRKSAVQGDAIAQFDLGRMYDFGKGVEEDDKRAVKWYQKAAEQGNARAQSNLGGMYRWGWGIEKDDEEAVKWYLKSAEQGFAWGQTELGEMYAAGEGVEEDDEEAVKLFRKAAGDRWASAQYNLGTMYVKGEGVEEDNKQAYLWYSLAAEQDNQDSKKRKGEAATKLTPEDIKKVNRWIKQWSTWKLTRGWPEDPQVTKGPFAALEKKFGFRVHYLENEIFAGDNDPTDTNAEPIKPDELKRLPQLLGKALAKYPPWVVQKYLNRVRMVESLSHDNRDTVVGLADLYYRSFYVEIADNNESWPDRAVEATFHHEFAHILDEKFPFPADEWRACNPKGFIYEKEKPYEQEKDLWEKGFVSNYAMEDVDEDFPEFSELIFTEPRKAKLLINHFPRLQAKYRIWLKVYQKIDPNYFTEKRFLPENLFSAKQPENMTEKNDLFQIKGAYYSLHSGKIFTGKTVGFEQGKKEYERHFVEGKKTSYVKFGWWNKDQIKHQVTYNNIVKHGSTIRWHENGKLKAKMNYVHGELDGIKREWHDNGQPKSEMMYQMGKVLVRTEWNPDGTLIK